MYINMYAIMYFYYMLLFFYGQGFIFRLLGFCAPYLYSHFHNVNIYISMIRVQNIKKVFQKYKILLESEEKCDKM